MAVNLAGRLIVPRDTEAILWDMDGVLLDTLSLDFDLCNRLLQKHLHEDAHVSRAVIQEYFPYALPEFWRLLVAASGAEAHVTDPASLIGKLVEEHERERQVVVCSLNPGVESVLREAREAGLKLAVVSNNPTEDVELMLRKSKLIEFFDKVIGNDLEEAAQKPAPDAYLLAARQLDVEPGQCMVVEDSLLGAEAGRRAGCYVVGVATGANGFESLTNSPHVDTAYTVFNENSARLSPGNVTVKQIETPNDFVSHMVEHIAWRMGCSVSLQWNNSDCFELGRQLGDAVSSLERLQDASAVLGMIDDGSAEVALTAAEKGGLTLHATAGVDLDWFLGLRCEQLKEGQPLLQMLEGLAEACGAQIDITVCTLEDPHHTWEGIFRSVGMALSQCYNPPAPEETCVEDAPPVRNDSDAGWTVFGGSISRAEVVRETAETKVRVAVDCSGFVPPQCHFDVAESVHVDGVGSLLEVLGREAGLGLEVELTAKELSSSHVVLEDIGMVLGRALKEIFIARMERVGINGAGSSIRTVSDLEQNPIRVGLSVEGRKFLCWVPFTIGYSQLRRDLIIGHTVGDGLFSEDLDDFLDGFAGGLTASVVLHIKECPPPGEGWPLIYACLGKAVAQALAHNPARKGVPPGVKATLA